MMDERYCQSCGMPMMATGEAYGTNADGSMSEDYCHYCYEKGAFTQDCTMDGMIDLCVPHMEANAGMNETEARKMMKEFFPTLKRWQQG